MGDLFGDLRYTLRRLRRTPLVSALAVLVLAGGIGATTAVYTLVDHVLVRPLPFADPDRLVVLWESNPQLGSERDQVSAPNLLDWQRSARTLDAFAAYEYDAVTLTGTAEPLQLGAARLTPGTFPLLATEPALGRGFLDPGSEPNGERVVVLSYGLWQRVFGGERGIVGRTINVDGAPHQVVGVMPRSFRYPDDNTEIWLPLTFDAQTLEQRARRSLGVVGRLREGATVEAARAELNAISAELARQHPRTNEGWGVAVVPAREQLVEDVRPALLAMLGAVGLVLLLAVVNLAGLLLVRTYARDREFVIRTALGARWSRIARQVLLESVLLSVLGGVVGMVLALLLVRLLVAGAADYLPFADLIAVDARVLVFGLGVSLAAGLLLGIAPTLRSARVSADHLRTGASTGGRRWIHLQDTLVAAEIGLALVLAVGAGLLVQSFVRLHRVDPGFDPEGVLVARLSLPSTQYPEEHQQLEFFERLTERLRQSPEVVAAGVVSALPLSQVGIDFDLPVQVAGREVAPGGEDPQADLRVASPGYFDALRMRLLGGRFLDQRDRDGGPRAMVINETMARQLWGGENPVGRQVSIPMGGPHEVVGVVADVRHRGLDQEARPEMYVPVQQTAFSSMTVVVRTRRAPEGFQRIFVEQVRAIDPNQPVSDLATMESVVAGSISEARLSSALASGLAVAALLLAALGVYGMISYSVATRTREFGLRMALGAAPRQLAGLVLTRGMRITLAGIGVGVLLAFWAMRTISGLLFGIEPLDAPTFLGVTVLLLAVAVVASVLPGMRAMRTDPVSALKAE